MQDIMNLYSGVISGEAFEDYQGIHSTFVDVNAWPAYFSPVLGENSIRWFNVVYLFSGQIDQ
jgi:hypothetical protein